MIRIVLGALLLVQSALAQTSPSASPAPGKAAWQTLNGAAPIVVARGGFSGLFPESSQYANEFAVSTSLGNCILYCNLQLTKDGIGICANDVRLDNSTNIADIYPKGEKTHNVSGQNVKGWFSLDFSSDEIFKGVALVQNMMSRSNLFDGAFPPSAVEDVVGIKGSKLWISVQNDLFYNQNKLSPAKYLEKSMRVGHVEYISSTEINFLKSMTGKINKNRTKLIFQFLGPDVVEQTTNQKYTAILKDLASIKSYATGILIPKEYIWPQDKKGYLDRPTTIVADAHKAGLEVYASGFANDFPLSYNYSYDPSAEYLQYVDNSDFSVDGFLTDFPPTALEAVECLAHNKNTSRPGKGQPLIISHNGASGVYPGCTDLAYEQAVSDGVDIIDCSVQMSKDGVPFCLDSCDLTGDTNALISFTTKSSTVPEIQPNSGIFSFDLTWSEIQSLTPQLQSPYGENGLVRNPVNKNKGKFISLGQFLDFAKKKAVGGVLISIENAAFLASKKGLSIVDAVTKGLSNATLDKQSTQKVIIQSDDTSVLSSFNSVQTYKRVFLIKEKIGDAPKKAAEEIKRYADAVNVQRASLIAAADFFTKSKTNVADEMHAANISVYVSGMKNEYLAIPFDFFSDPLVELSTFAGLISVDAVITDFPSTANAYFRSPCSDLNKDLKYTILPAEPGSLLSLAPAESLPPAQAPEPPLNPDNIVDPPLPPVTAAPAGESNGSSSSSTAPIASAPQGQSPTSSAVTNMVDLGVYLMALLILFL